MTTPQRLDMLHLRIGFPTGRYYAAASADPRQPEWPPHPSRIFSALVAAAYGGGRQPTSHERHVLQTIESAPPPQLSYPEADVTPAPDVYVPVNDPDTRIKAKKLQSRGVLFANRQVRQFPSAFLLDHPEVVLSWPLAISKEELATLDQLASQMTHVGTSHALVTATFVSGVLSSRVRLIPAPAGERYLRVPQPGRLLELDQLAVEGYGTLRRPVPRCETLCSYMCADSVQDDTTPSLYDWVMIRLRGASWGADTAHTLARAVRRATLSLAGDIAPACLHGHDITVRHIAWLPLPEVGHAYARGRIRGIAIALPLSAPQPERTGILAMLARLRTVVLPDGQYAQLDPLIEQHDTPIGLRAGTWLQSSTQWSTVTPVLLDRPPKRSTPNAILDAVAESLVNAGYPNPVALRATRESDFTGAPAALDIPTRIPRWHVRAQFAQPLCGPVLAGRWRNFGVGLFRPLHPKG